MRKLLRAGAALVGVTTCHAQGEEADMAALLAFKAGGDPNDMLASWSSSSSPTPCSSPTPGWRDGAYNDWRYVSCNAEGGRVIRIQLDYGDPLLTGTLSSLTPLTALTELDLQGTGVTGSLADIAGMTQLTRLRLGSCPAVTGSLGDLAGLTGLTSLDLRGNTLVTGDINADLAGMTQLWELFLAGTSVHGDAAGLRAAIPALFNRGHEWGDPYGPVVVWDFTTCTFLPCGTDTCVTDTTNPAGACGAPDCGPADARLLGTTPIEQLRDLFNSETGGEPDGVHQLTYRCQTCYGAHSSEIRAQMPDPGDSPPLMSDFSAALLAVCGLASAAPAEPELPTSCADFGEFSIFSDLVTATCCVAGVDCPPGGIPTSCTAACAAILLPFQQTCASFLAMIGMVDTVSQAVETCPAQCPVDPRSAECIEEDRAALCTEWGLHWDSNAKTCTGGGH
eukprot:COSAG06_NODE_4934_length_3850_cov_14.047187_2_plen_450_part_00